MRLFVRDRFAAFILVSSVLVLGTFSVEANAQTPRYQTLTKDGGQRPRRLQKEPVTLRESEVPITSAVFSTNGTTLTTVDGKGRVVVCDIATPGIQTEVANVGKELVCAVVSEDGKLLAYASQGRMVAVIQLSTNEMKIRAQSQQGRTVALAFSKSGKLLAGAQDTGDVALWDMTSGMRLQQFSVEPSALQTLAFSVDEKSLAVGTYSNKVLVFDLESNHPPRPLDLGKSRVTALAYSPDNVIVVACADGTTRIYRTPDDKPILLEGRAFAVWRLAFDAKGKRLASASWDGSIRLWDTATWQPLEDHKALEQSISAMAFSARGDLVAAALGGRMKHWKPGIPTIEATAMITGRPDSVWVTSYSPDGKLLFVGGRKNRFELWDLHAKQLKVSREGQPTTRCAVFSPDGQTLVTGGDDGKVILWDPRRAETKLQMHAHPGSVSAVVYTPNGETLVSACDGGFVKVWNPTTGEEKASWHEHQRQIYCANISPDGRWLVTGGGDWTSDAPGELVVTELATGRVHSRLPGNRLALWSIVFKPDGRHFATTCSSGEVKIWDFETQREIRNLPHATWTRGLAFSPDGKSLAVGLGDGSTLIWNTANWQAVASCEGPDSFAFHLHFDPTGDALTTSGNDGNVRFWPVKNLVQPLPMD